VLVGRQDAIATDAKVTLVDNDSLNDQNLPTQSKPNPEARKLLKTIYQSVRKIHHAIGNK